MSKNDSILLVLLSALLAPATGRADEKVPLRELDLVWDGKGHYIAYRPRKPDPQSPGNTLHAALYVGDGKIFHPVRTVSFSQDKQFEIGFYDHRFVAARQTSRIPRRVQKFIGDQARQVLHCGMTSRAFRPVSEREREHIVATAQQKEEVRGRHSHRLARDNRGTYYYVDSHPDIERPYDKHLYIGRRGKMKRVPLLDVALDRAGELYVAKSGSLRFDARSKDSALWIPANNRKPTELVAINTDDDRTEVFIYNDLGMYLGQPMGTPCDWL